MTDPVIPPTVPPPGEPPAPIAPPAPPVIDPLEYAQLKASHAALEAHKTKVDREREKERAERAREKQDRDAQRALLVKAGLIPDDTADPAEQLKKREDAERASRDAETALELGLSRALFGRGLVPKDGDLDYVLFKVRKDPALLEAAKGGVTDEFIESLKSKGYVATLSVAPPAPPTAPKLPDKKLPESGGAPPDPIYANVKTLQQLTELGHSKVEAFREKYPDRYALLEKEHSSRFMRIGGARS